MSHVRLYNPDDDVPPGEVPREEQERIKAEILEERQRKKQAAKYAHNKHGSAVYRPLDLKVYPTDWVGQIARDAEYE